MAFKTTAINGSNVAVTDQSGKIGNVRYYQKNGHTYVRAAKNKTSASSNPRTDAQMKTRLLHNSLVNIWKLISPYMTGAFENKEVNQSDVNAFLQQNAGKGVYFTKQQFANRCSVDLPLLYANGTLTEITIASKGANGFVSNIAVSGTPTTIGALSSAIIAGNEGYENSDKISLIYFKQGGTSADNYKTVASSQQIVLDTTSAVALPSWLKIAGGVVCFDVDATTIAAIHGNGTSVSRAVAFSINSAVYSAMTSAQQFQLARDSYGKARDMYLTGSGPVDTSVDYGSVTISVLVSPAEHGAVSGAGVYAKGSTVTLTATPGSGYMFNKWSDNNSDNPVRTITANDDMELTAYFKVVSDGGAGQ